MINLCNIIHYLNNARKAACISTTQRSLVEAYNLLVLFYLLLLPWQLELMQRSFVELEFIGISAKGSPWNHIVKFKEMIVHEVKGVFEPPLSNVQAI